MTEAEPSGGAVFDISRIRRLVELMEQHDLGEVDLREGEQRIRLRRGAAPPAPASLPSSTAVSQAPQVAAAAAPAAEPADEAHIAYIKSPMVGTFYTKPNPNAATYVKVGDHVEPETTVCIIEAMKVFNEIPAEVRGKIVAVLVDNEEPVEFGKPLYKVDTSQ